MDKTDRQSFYLSNESSTLFCWMHKPQQDIKQRDCAVVICSPLGYEYILSHRSVRHLADYLANDGFQTIRFDYAGTGDSSGDDFDPNRLDTWKSNIKAVIAHAKMATGCSKICLIGIRMGALLSALITSEGGTPPANELGVSHLVLWNPCVQGQHYVREMKALALAFDPISTETNPKIESAGFILSAETARQINNLNMENMPPPHETAILLIDRDDRPQCANLLEKWTKDFFHIDYLVQSGHLEMFAEPHNTVVPVHTLCAISEWLTKNTQEATRAQVRAKDFLPLQKINEQVAISEHLCRFGARGQLFGILTTPISKTDCVMPTILLLNAGSVHHVGPQRLYVVLARALAVQGFPSFRIDFEGIGDSDLQNVSNENHPYQASALQDTESALCFLSEQFHAVKFVLTGICSGAYTAFRFGLGTTPYKIVDTLLINPLTFYWEQGMSLSMDSLKLKAIRKLSHYRESVYNRKQWTKLLKGEISRKATANIVLTQMKLFVKSYTKNLMEKVYPQTDSQLSADIKNYFSVGRHLSLFFSKTDPGLDIIKADARKILKKGINEKKIILQMFQDADHTFSRSQKRDELIGRVGKHLTALTKIAS